MGGGRIFRLRQSTNHRARWVLGSATSVVFDVVRHREAVHDPERKCDPLRSPELMRPNEPVTCGDAVLDARRRRRPVAGDCE